MQTRTLFPPVFWGAEGVSGLGCRALRRLGIEAQTNPKQKNPKPPNIGALMIRMGLCILLLLLSFCCVCVCCCFFFGGGGVILVFGA